MMPGAVARWPKPVIMAGALLTLIGLILRIAGARGDLGFDEILTLYLVNSVPSVPDIVYGINHDNNHILNSIYLKLVGIYRPPIVLRGYAILFGTLTIPAAGLAAAGKTRNCLAALVAMVLFSLGYPFVHYGSEARGYAGLILCMLLAVHILECRPNTIGNRLLFGLIAIIGTLSQFLMIMGLGGFALWYFQASFRRTRSVVTGAIETLSYFSVALLLIGLLAVVTLVGLRAHPLRIGMVTQTTLRGFIDCYGWLPGYMVGLAQKWSAPYCLAAMLLFAGYYCMNRVGAPDDRVALYVIFIFVLPAVLLMSGIANTTAPRYFFCSFTMFMLLLGEAASRAFRGSRRRRAFLLAVGVVLLLGDGTSLYRFLKVGRGHYAVALHRMVADGPETYSGDNDLMTPSYYVHRDGLPLMEVSQEDWCRNPPRWFIHTDAWASTPDTIVAGPAACPIIMKKVEAYPSWGLSGLQWTLYSSREW